MSFSEMKSLIRFQNLFCKIVLFVCMYNRKKKTFYRFFFFFKSTEYLGFKILLECLIVLNSPMFLYYPSFINDVNSFLFYLASILLIVLSFLCFLNHFLFIFFVFIIKITDIFHQSFPLLFFILTPSLAVPLLFFNLKISCTSL